MIVRLKRIYSFFIELLMVFVFCLFAYEIIGMGLFFIISDSFRTSKYMYMYALPIFAILSFFYFCFRNFIHGQSILQMLFGIRYEYNNKKQLLFKNVIDLVLLPVSFLTVLFWNKSVGDLLFHISVVEKAKTDSKSNDSFFYIMVVWFTVIPLFFCLALSGRVSKAEQHFRFRLNNTQTIKDNIGTIQDFSFRNKLIWTKYDKDGKYTEATIKNEENKEFKIKIYRSDDLPEEDYYVIDGKRYAYEMEHFALNDYLLFVEGFKESMQVHAIENEEDALAAAEEAYKIQNGNDKAYMTYKIFYDKENHCYLICYVNSMDDAPSEDDYHVIVQEDGQVLAMWMGK